MKLLNTLAILLFCSTTFAAALPAAMPQATDITPAAPTEPASPSVDDDSGPELTSLSLLPDGCPNCTSSDLKDLNFLPYSFTGWKVSSLRGNSFIGLHSNGNVRLQYHFKNVASLASVKYAIGCAIRAGLPGEPAHAFGAIHNGKINPAADPNHTADFDETYNNPLLAQYWSEIITGDMVMHCEVKAGFDLAGMFDFLMKNIMKYGPLIGQLILLF